ncbi:MAG: hypothetical protein K1X78_25940 [Verrucomicrobiaceae bacterium]|nr:hypothetical protein [Verrucomicrobiaceae bacterium]
MNPATLIRHTLIAACFTLAIGCRTAAFGQDPPLVEVKCLLVGPEEVEKSMKIVGGTKENESMDVAFFDTPALSLFSKEDLAVILRLRIETGMKDGVAETKVETTVKLRAGTKPLDSNMISQDIIDVESGKKVEAKREGDITLKQGDASSSKKDSYSLNARVPKNVDAHAVLKTGKDIASLFMKTQRDAVMKAVPGTTFDSLAVYGPVVKVLRWKKLSLGPDLPEKSGTVERWSLPEHHGRPALEMVEFSVRVPDTEADTAKASAALKKLMATMDVTLATGSEAKTKIVLEHFSN